MSFRTIINRDGSQWMKGAGPEQDVVIGSRIRLARTSGSFPGLPPMKTGPRC